jgi:hypothetical protein
MATFYKEGKTTKFDLNRHRKIYRYIRKKPIFMDPSDITEFTWGTFFVDFDNQTSVTHYWPFCFDGTPVVAVATSVENGDNNGNINVYIPTTTADYGIFETSRPFTGRVNYQALKEGVYNMPNIGKKLEVVELSYASTNSKTYTWTANFECTPIVTATASEDVNVFVSAVSKTQVTVEVSVSNYSGKVYLVGIERGC